MLYCRLLDLEDEVVAMRRERPGYDPYMMGPEFYTGWFERMDQSTWDTTPRPASSPCEDCEYRPLHEPAPPFKQGQCCLSPTRVSHLRPPPAEYNAD